MEMRIAIDLTSLSYHLTGIERYAMGVTDKMIDLDKKNEYVLIFRKDIHPLFKDRIDGNRVKSLILYGENKLYFMQIVLARALWKIIADYYIFFAFPSPVMFRKKRIINTIHDMGAWDSSDQMKGLAKYYFRISYRNATQISDRIITVSNFSKQRIMKILNIDESRVSVINSAVYSGIDLSKSKGLNYDLIKKRYKLPNKYIMTLSTLEPRKNMKILLEAFDHIADKVDYDVVLVGRKGWKIDDLLDKYASKSRVHITGFVEDNHLSLVYRNALCFVFPSLYEGFGLPPVEALSLGVPVVSSDAASLPEILMSQAVYFQSNNINQLEKILLDLEINIKTMPRGFNEFQTENYNFETAALKVIDLIK